jgi:hypothetical protein
MDITQGGKNIIYRQIDLGSSSGEATELIGSNPILSLPPVLCL